MSKQERKIRHKCEGNKKKSGRNEASASECNRQSKFQSLHRNCTPTHHLQPPRV